MELSAPGLQNALLRLDPICDEHRDVIFASNVQESIWKWMPALRGGSNLSNYFDFILQAQKAGTAATFVLFLRGTDTFAGITGFNEINKVHRRVRNALAWHPNELEVPDLYLAGQAAMIDRAYEWGAKRLEWQVNSNNQFILAGLEMIGPSQEAVFRNYERTADGIWVDKIVFGMTRKEMEQASARLNAHIA